MNERQFFKILRQEFGIKKRQYENVTYEKYLALECEYIEQGYRTSPINIIAHLVDEAMLGRNATLDEPQKTQWRPHEIKAGFVYLLKSGTLYKIGASSKVGARIKRLTSILPLGGTLVCTIRTNNMYQLERELHEQFDDKRVKGEWFELTNQDVAAIKAYKGA